MPYTYTRVIQKKTFDYRSASSFFTPVVCVQPLGNICLLRTIIKNVTLLLRRMAMICELLRTTVFPSTLFVLNEKKKNQKQIYINKRVVTVYVLQRRGFQSVSTFLSSLVLCHELILNINFEQEMA